MADSFEFISPADKPALLAISAPEWLAMAQSAVAELGYKSHAVQTHQDFQTRFNQLQYQIIIIEEIFGGGTAIENTSLHFIQRMPMVQRRHATFFLISDAYETMNVLQAFQQSVHAVINYSEISLLGQIVQKVVGDNDLFYNTYRDIQQRIAQGKK
jgi:hypothetical protein